MRARLTFDRLAVALLFLATFASACLMPAQNDTWWHLRTGQEIWQARAPLLTETFSFTAPGAFWPNHEWLTQLGFYVLYSIGGLALLTAFGALLVTLAWVISWSLMAGQVKRRVLLVAMGLPPYATEWAIRPQLMTLFLLPLVTWCLLRRKLLWLPLIFMLWANLHGGFILGLVVLAIASAAMIVKDRSRWPALTATFGLSVLATLVNPLGIRLWSAVFESINKSASIGVAEYRAAQLLAPENLTFWILALLLAGLSIRRARQIWVDPSWPLVATSLFLLPVAFRYGRNIPLFLLLAVPAISRLLAIGTPVLASERSARRENPALNVAFLVTFVVLAVSGVAYAWKVPIKRLQWEPLPPAAIAAVAACPDQIYNRYDDGGYLLWFVQSRRVFIDSRQDPYPLELLQEHIRSENSGDYTAIFARYGIHCAFLPAASPIAKKLPRDRWLPVYEDGRWVVLRDADVR